VSATLADSSPGARTTSQSGVDSPLIRVPPHRREPSHVSTRSGPSPTFAVYSVLSHVVASDTLRLLPGAAKLDRPDLSQGLSDQIKLGRCGPPASARAAALVACVVVAHGPHVVAVVKQVHPEPERTKLSDCPDQGRAGSAPRLIFDGSSVKERCIIPLRGLWQLVSGFSVQNSSVKSA
jgi:hypothetical protein